MGNKAVTMLEKACRYGFRNAEWSVSKRCDDARNEVPLWRNGFEQSARIPNRVNDPIFPSCGLIY
jgi:hypothetical protein